MRKYILTTLTVLSLLLSLSQAAQSWPGGIDAGSSFGYSSEESGTGAYLGVDISDISTERLNALKLKEEKGVEVTMVDQDAPAGKAGIKEHDVILTMNGTAIESGAQLRRMIHETPAGRVVTFGLSRDGQPLTVKVQLGDRHKEFSYTPKDKDRDKDKDKDFHILHAADAQPSRLRYPAGQRRSGALLGAKRVDGGESYASTGRVLRGEEWKWSAGPIGGEGQSG